MTNPVFIAVPSYGGQPAAEMTFSLTLAMEEARAMRRPATLRIRSGDSLLTRARNVLVQQFLDSGAEILVFWDDDVACAPGDFERLLSAEAPIVSGAYRFRSEPLGYPIRPLKEGWREAEGLIEVEGVGGGFLAITRAAIERMIAARPGAWFNDREVGRAPLLFENLVIDHDLHSEDFVFCRRVRDAGLRIFVEPTIQLTHVGRKAFQGDFNRWLAHRVNAAAPIGAAEAAKARLDAAYERALGA
jgi:hypothetical protein